MDNKYRVPLLVWNNRCTILDTEKIPDPIDSPLLILTGELGSETVELSFGKVEGIQISLESLAEACQVLKEYLLPEKMAERLANA